MAWWLFQNVVTTAALAAIVALVCRAVPLGPTTRHALWVIVLVKFITPPLVVWPWPAPDPLGIVAIAETYEPEVVDESDAGASVGGALSSGDAERDAEQVSETRPSDTGVALWNRVPLMTWLLWLWAAGTVGVVATEGVRLARMAARVRRARPGNPAIVERVAALAQNIGVRPIAVREMAGGTQPAVWAVGRPMLLWPADLADSSAACIDGVIVHELAHLKRRDHFVAWIELAAAIVWWWNPLFWIVRAARREQAELACDAWVIGAVPDGRRAYAESLLALSGATLPRSSSQSIAVVGIGAVSRRALERRLVMIMKGRARRRLPLAGILSLTMIAVATLPAWATQDPVPPPPPPAPVVAVPQQPPPPPASAPNRRAIRPAPAARAARTPPTRPSVAPAPPQARRVTAVVPPRTQRYVLAISPANLPAEGRTLVQSFEGERQSIQEEANRKIVERRDALTKALQELQEEYTKAGRLDEAVAIRDYLRRGGPGRDFDLRLSDKVPARIRR